MIICFQESPVFYKHYVLPLRPHESLSSPSVCCKTKFLISCASIFPERECPFLPPPPPCWSPVLTAKQSLTFQHGEATIVMLPSDTIAFIGHAYKRLRLFNIINFILLRSCSHIFRQSKRQTAKSLSRFSNV